MLTVLLVQRNINNQKCLGYLFHKIGVTASQNQGGICSVEFVVQIFSQTLFGVWTYFDDFRPESVCCKKLKGCINCNILPCYDFSYILQKSFKV